jgi:four helix bundle protein
VRANANANANADQSQDKVKRFDQSKVWQDARILALAIYRLTAEAKFEKDWTLRDQIRRAAISVMSNIAEGSERGSSKEFVHFLDIASGSSAEIKSQLYLALDLGYLDESRFQKAEELINSIIRQIRGLQRQLRTNPVK